MLDQVFKLPFNLGIEAPLVLLLVNTRIHFIYFINAGSSF